MYNHQEIEKKWQKEWEKNQTYKTSNDTTKPKIYTLIEFPYPSWVWLHVWHVKGQTAVDIYARYKRMCWYNVLNCMWWDAFGLPAENFAIKNKKHPDIFTQENIATFKKQIQSFWPSFDWEREIDTTDPKYYKWTQWIFLKLFEAWLAYEKKAPINWCPSCKTGLANEEVIDGKCERCDNEVEQKLMKQWFLAITKYADKLWNDLSDVNWPEYIKTSQKNWIWRSEGCEFEMKLFWHNEMKLSVFTTRIDTVFGMTYAVIAPDHPEISKFITEEQKKTCQEYIENTKNKSAMERTQLNKNKTWIFTGSYVINPYNNEKFPLWIADYVLWNYGTWAVMAVPAHDERDFEFAKKYDLPIKASLSFWQELPFIQDGVLVNSWEFSGLKSEEAREKLTQFAFENNFWKKISNYKLRDWLFSRQRYRWEPIPLIHLEIENIKKLPHISELSQAIDPNLAYILKRDPKDRESICDFSTCHGKVRELIINQKVFSKIYDSIDSKIVIDKNLPLILPEIENYEPSGDGQSPLAKIDNFVHIQLAKNLSGKRETNTMPQWAGSSWYFLRYIDPKNDTEFASQEKLKYFMPVDIYFGWAEHTTVHLLYSRFWNKVLYDLWIVPVLEPYKRRVQHGLIQWEDGRKMSKRWGNVINPDDVIEKYGADTMRAYIMFMGPYWEWVPWSTSAIAGVNRFIHKIHALQEKIIPKDDDETIKLLHKSIKKIQEDIENIAYHTAISTAMIFLNSVLNKGISKENLKIFLQILAPFVPFITEEIWYSLGEKQSIHLSSWPQYDANIIQDTSIVIWIQVLGKLRWELEIEVTDTKENVLLKAKKMKEIQKWIEWKEIIKEIYVTGKIVNIVVK